LRGIGRHPTRCIRNRQVIGSSPIVGSILSITYLICSLSLKLKVGCVELTALDYPFGGIALFFTGVGSRSMAQFEIRLPNRRSSEMVAGMIYANIARIFPEDAPIWKRHFQNLKLPLFQ